MKKNQVNEILVNQTRRRNTIFSYSCVILIFLVLALGAFVLYDKNREEQYVGYSEKSFIDYKIYLKKNKFFENNYLESDKQYISRLIDYVKANFRYDLTLDEAKTEYKYSYRIESFVDVVQKETGNSLYSKTSTILENKEFTTDKQSIQISEWVDIDYNKYNNLISKFVNVYDLDDTTSTLTINLYVDVIGECEEFSNSNNGSVMSLTIPLTTKTIAIDLSNNLINSENKVLLCEEVNSITYLYLIFAIFSVVLSLLFIAILIRFIIRTRTAEDMYERELKKILNNYGSYIQTLNSEFDFRNYQLLKLNNFTDMLEIRDTVRQPILMKENETKTGAYFVIPTSSNILYFYRLRVSDIKRKIKQKKESKED